MSRLGYFQKLAQKAKETTNSKEAEAIKRKLIRIGLIMAILGIGGAFACFVSFVICSFSMVNNMSFSPLISIPFILFIPCGFVGGIGATILNLGLGIVVAKGTVNFLDTNSYCPNCGDVISEDEKYCSKCGKPLLVNKVCNNCHKENDIDAKYCINCGNKLDD